LYNNMSVLLGNGDGTFQAARNYAVGRQATRVAVVDVNRDGLAELIVDNGAISGDVTVPLRLASVSALRASNRDARACRSGA
jgi:hypothetical protein